MKKKTGRKTRDAHFVEAMEDFPDELIEGYRLAVIKQIKSLSIEDFRIWWSFLIKEKLDLIVKDGIWEKKQISVAEIVKAARKKLDEENK